jgi:hypothetical protein
MLFTTLHDVLDMAGPSQPPQTQRQRTEANPQPDAAKGKRKVKVSEKARQVINTHRISQYVTSAQKHGQW